MASQEQYYFVFFPQGEVPHPQLNKLVGFGQPARHHRWRKCGKSGMISRLMPTSSSIR
jgi:hypothetical protein